MKQSMTNILTKTATVALLGLNQLALAQLEFLPDSTTTWEDEPLTLLDGNDNPVATVKVITSASKPIEWGTVKLVEYWFTILLNDTSPTSSYMPSGDLKTWAIEWIITLPSGNTENGSLKMTSGKNLELV